jgi:hypothetical protein
MAFPARDIPTVGVPSSITSFAALGRSSGSFPSAPGCRACRGDALLGRGHDAPVQVDILPAQAQRLAWHAPRCGLSISTWPLATLACGA